MRNFIGRTYPLVIKHQSTPLRVLAFRSLHNGVHLYEKKRAFTHPSGSQNSEIDLCNMTTPSSSTASVMSQATAVDSDATRSIEMGRSPTTGPRDEKQKSAVQKRDPQPDQAQAQAQRRPPAGVANPNRVEKEQDEWEVRWDGENDPGDPLNTPTWKKWYVI